MRNIGGLHRQIAGDHRGGVSVIMPIAPDSGTPIFFASSAPGWAIRCASVTCLLGYEFLNNAFFIHD